MCAALLEQRARDACATAKRSSRAATDALSLPDTVQGVIRARLDNLDAACARDRPGRVGHRLRSSITRCSAEVAPAERGPRAGHRRARSRRAHPADGGRAEPSAYRFTHALTQEVCYDSLVGHQRKMLHGAIGRALERRARRTGWTSSAALLAHHFGRAEEWPAAIRFGRRAAERAIALSQFADALATLDQVLEWVGRLPDDAERSELIADLLLQQERLCETLGLRARQQRIIDALIAQLAPRRAVGAAGRGLPAPGRSLDAAQAIRRGRSRAGHGAPDRPRARRRALLSSALRSLGLLRWHEGRHDEALEITQRALAIDRECDDEVAVAGDLTNLGSILRAMGDYAGARDELEEALAMPALRNDPKKLVYALHNLANVHRAMGDLDRALECLHRERRDRARPSAADPAIVPPDVDRAYPAAAGPASKLRSRPIAPRSI